MKYNPENLTDEELDEQIEINKSVSERMVDKEILRINLNEEELRRIKQSLIP